MLALGKQHRGNSRVTSGVKHHDPADDATGQLPGPEVISALEDRLRTAFRAKASDVSVPASLELRQRRGIAGTLTSSKWMASVAAAIGVLVIIAGALAVAGALPGRQSAPGGPTETKVPPYYVALLASQPTSGDALAPVATVAVVRATSTGAVLASVNPPRPYTFVSVTAAAGDRSFVLLAVGPSRMIPKNDPYVSSYLTYAQQFFVLRIHPTAATSAARARLTALPQIGIASGQQAEEMALSPSGQSLAVIFTDPSRAIRAFIPGELTIYNLADGTRRTWIRNVCADGRCEPGPIGDGSVLENASEVQLSWTSDGRSLLFLTGPVGAQARLLDVDARGRSLIADSHALPIGTGIPNLTDAVITPDGQSVFIQYSTMSGLVSRNILVRVSATTGKTAAVIQVLRNGDRPDFLLWTNDDGSKFVAIQSKLGAVGEAIPSGQTAVIYSGGRYAQLPWPTGVVDAAW
jgi:hypothetical protein